MKNEYKINNNTVIIYCKSKRDNCLYEIIIDKDDFYKVEKLNYSVYYSKTHFGKYYAQITEYLGTKNGKPKYKQILLHRLLVDFPEYKIDHRDGDTKNNRKNNLRKVTVSQNSKNRKSKNSNNTSGYRNVSFMNGYWRIQLQVDGKNKLFSEKFTDIDLAGKFAKEMRKKYYGKYSGKN